MTAVLQEGMKKLRDQQSEQVGDSTEVISEETEALEQQPEVVDADTKESDESEQPSPDQKYKHDKKKNSLQERINSKHAELMQAKELLLAEKEEKAALLKRLEALEKQASSPKKEEVEDEISIDDVDDLTKYLKKLVSKEELDRLVVDAVNKELLKAREKLETESKQQKMQRLQGEFYSKLNDYYNPENDVDFVLNDEAKQEAVQMVELFNGSPDRINEIAKKHGISYLRKFITGQLEAEQKAERIKSIITKADAVRTNIGNNNNVKEIEDDKPAKTWHDLFAKNIKKAKIGV